MSDPSRTNEPDWAYDALGHGCFARDLDGATHGFVPSIRDRLIARGVLTCVDGIWRLAWHGFDLEKERAADMSCCDFCSARPVTWLCPCVTFRMPEAPGTSRAYSTGDWAACDACGQDVWRRNKLGLLQRAQTILPPGTTAADIDPDLRRVLKAFKRELHERFWRHYQGGAVRITPHPFGH